MMYTDVRVFGYGLSFKQGLRLSESDTINPAQVELKVLTVCTVNFVVNFAGDATSPSETRFSTGHQHSFAIDITLSPTSL